MSKLLSDFKPKCRISNKFDVPSIYYDGIYYFLADVKSLKDGKYPIQVVYKSYKWYQDTHYISDDLLTKLVDYRITSLNN